MNSLRINIVLLWYQSNTPRLLDLLSAEPRWGEGEVCEECQVSFDIRCGKGGKDIFFDWMKMEDTQAKFGLTTRRHHCRHCGRLLCSKCSAKEMPIIKYNLSKQVVTDLETSFKTSCNSGSRLWCLRRFTYTRCWGWREPLLKGFFYPASQPWYTWVRNFCKICKSIWLTNIAQRWANNSVFE